MPKKSLNSVKRPIIVALLAVALIIAILAWRSLVPDDPVTLTDARAEPVAGAPGVVHVYMTVETGARPDRLLGAAAPDARGAQIVAPEGVREPAIPAQAAAALSSDGVYLRLEGVEGVLDEGRLIPVALTFARSGRITVRARVGESADPHAGHGTMATVPAASSQGEAPPSVEMTLEPAANDATLVRLKIANFSFDRGGDPPEHVPGKGHAHLYLDGLKLQRMYSPEALVGALPPGTYTLRAELNTNTHLPYLGPDGPIGATAELVVN